MCPAPAISRILRDFKVQLLRWNPQINLVSRQSTDQRIDSLILQGMAGIEAVLDHLGVRDESAEDGATQALNYFDLGSGGGMPGIVWHCRLAELGLSPATCLVEPRTKRAWFLERLGGLRGMERFSVLCERWGDDFGEDAPPCPKLEVSAAQEDGSLSRQGGNILISLKALKLTDKQILAGLGRIVLDSELDWENRCLLIARYYPPGQTLDSELTSELGIPAPGSSLDGPGLVGGALGGLVLPLQGENGPCASLVLSEYSLHASQ